MRSKTLASTLVALVLMWGALVAYEYARLPNFYAFQKSTVEVEFINPDSQEKFGHCSGVYLGNGRVLTAGHCTDKASDNVAIYVRPYDSDKRVYAKVVDTTLTNTALGVPKSDLGLLKLERNLKGVRKASVSCRTPEIGEHLYAVGMPSRLQWTVTEGTVTTQVPRGDLGVGRWIQLDMTIIGGNSGGPVFDKYGNVVGIVSHTLSRLGGMIPTGHAYAVSGPIVCAFLQDDQRKADL